MTKTSQIRIGVPTAKGSALRQGAPAMRCATRRKTIPAGTSPNGSSDRASNTVAPTAASVSTGRCSLVPPAPSGVGRRKTKRANPHANMITARARGNTVGFPATSPATGQVVDCWTMIAAIAQRIVPATRSPERFRGFMRPLRPSSAGRPPPAQARAPSRCRRGTRCTSRARHWRAAAPSRP